MLLGVSDTACVVVWCFTVGEEAGEGTEAALTLKHLLSAEADPAKGQVQGYGYDDRHHKKPPIHWINK